MIVALIVGAAIAARYWPRLRPPEPKALIVAENPEDAIGHVVDYAAMEGFDITVHTPSTTQFSRRAPMSRENPYRVRCGDPLVWYRDLALYRVRTLLLDIEAGSVDFGTGAERGSPRCDAHPPGYRSPRAKGSPQVDS